MTLLNKWHQCQVGKWRGNYKVILWRVRSIDREVLAGLEILIRFMNLKKIPLLYSRVPLTSDCENWPINFSRRKDSCCHNWEAHSATIHGIVYLRKIAAELWRIVGTWCRPLQILRLLHYSLAKGQKYFTPKKEYIFGLVTEDRGRKRMTGHYVHYGHYVIATTKLVLLLTVEHLVPGDTICLKAQQKYLVHIMRCV